MLSITNLPAAPVKPRKRRRVQDPTFKPEKSSRKNSDSLSLTRMRSNAKNIVMDENGDKVEKKTAVLFRKSKLTDTMSSPYAKRFTALLPAKLAEIKSNLPIEKIEEVSPDGIPTKVLAVNGTSLFLKDQNGFSFLYTNEVGTPSPVKPKTVEKEEKFAASSPFREIKPNTGKLEFSAIEITSELLEYAEKQIKKNKGRRIMSQHKVMVKPGIAESKGSASRYAKASGEFPDELKWEWLHFIAHKFLANHSQNEKNMGCGTAHANTEMLFVECKIPEFAEAYPKGFHLKVTPNFMDGPLGIQILSTIHYTVITDDFELPFVFDAQKSKKPDFLNHEYTGALVATLLKTKEDTATITPVRPPAHSSKFFFTPSEFTATIASEPEPLSTALPVRRLSFSAL